MIDQLTFGVSVTEDQDGWTAEIRGTDRGPGVVGPTFDNPREAIWEAIDDFLIGAGFIAPRDDDD